MLNGALPFYVSMDQLTPNLVSPEVSLKDAAALIARLQKAGIKSYKQLQADGTLEETTVRLYLPSGIVPVDHILGGGLPAGRITEIFGPEASYKTGLAQMVMECALHMNGVGVYYDNEETYDEGKSVLHTFDTFLYQIVDVLEEFYVDVKTKLKIISEAKKELSVVLWDSMPATLPRQLIESDEGDRTLGEAARVNTNEIPRIKRLIRDALCAFIMINQVRSNMKMVNKWDTPYQTPGGWATKFFATLRLQMIPRGRFIWYADSTETNGVYIEVMVEKNKNTNPFQKARFPIVYQDQRGGDPAIAYFDWATTHADKFVSIAGAGRWNFGAVVPNLSVHKTDFHLAYLENLDTFLDFYTEKTGFAYEPLPRFGVKALTNRLYSNTTKVVRSAKAVKAPK